MLKYLPVLVLAVIVVLMSIQCWRCYVTGRRYTFDLPRFRGNWREEMRDGLDALDERDERLARILARIHGIGPDWSDDQHTSVPIGDLRYLASRLASAPTTEETT